MSELFRTMSRFARKVPIRKYGMGFKRNKFNAVKQNGYDSKMEARAGAELELLKKGGVIKDFRRQKSVDLIVTGIITAQTDGWLEGKHPCKIGKPLPETGWKGRGKGSLSHK